MIGSGFEEPIFSDFAREPVYAPLLAAFVEELPSLVAEIDEAVIRRDALEARRLAHRLKGAAATYGFPALADAAAALETTVRSAQADARSPDLFVLSTQARALVCLGSRVRAGLPYGGR